MEQQTRQVRVRKKPKITRSRTVRVISKHIETGLVAGAVICEIMLNQTESISNAAFFYLTAGSCWQIKAQIC